MTAKHHVTLLTTAQLDSLDAACAIIRRAFGRPPYLVGTAGMGTADSYRDVDIRLILADDEFGAACPDRERWEVLSLSLGIGAYLRERTGLPIDFQVQRMTEANERFSGPRNPLGMGRIFAGGGDGTPDWGSPGPEPAAVP